MNAIMNNELVNLKDKLSAMEEQKAVECYAMLRIANPAIDHATTKEAQKIYGNKNRFNWHVREGHIRPIRGFTEKSRKVWSRFDIYNLKKSERIILELA